MLKFRRMVLTAALFSAMMLAFGNAFADEAKFVLREYNGKVALFSVGEEEPIAVYSNSVDSFYPADRELLHSGIALSSHKELVQLIEDLELS